MSEVEQGVGLRLDRQRRVVVHLMCWSGEVIKPPSQIG